VQFLLHSCCAPCTIYPLERILLTKQPPDQIVVLFYNPNIHPYTEYRNRLKSLQSYLEEKKVSLLVPEDYELETFFREVVHNEKKRCNICYNLRLDYLFWYARKNDFDAVSTTLLYSRYQNHAYLKRYLETKAGEFSLAFDYQDYRKGWQFGQEKAIDKNMYRQKYCGCIYSEQERYDNKLKKRLRKERKGLTSI